MFVLSRRNHLRIRLKESGTGAGLIPGSLGETAMLSTRIVSIEALKDTKNDKIFQCHHPHPRTNVG